MRRMLLWLMRAIGLFIPAAGESIEMSYSYDAPFVMEDSDWCRKFGDGPTEWESA